MDIALIMHELLMEGGGERQFLSLARALAARGNAVTVYTTDYDPQGCYAEICKSLIIREVGRGKFRWLRKPRFLRAYLDMLHLGTAINERHEVWNPHHWPAQWAATSLKKRLGGAVVWMCNDVPDFFTNARAASLFNPVRRGVQALYYLLDRRRNRTVDITMLLSRWAESEFRAIYDSQTCVVRSGADPLKFFPGGDREQIRSRFAYSNDDFVLLWLGIFMPHRRLEDAIHAVRSLRCRGVKVHLLMAGSDRCHAAYVDTLRSMVKKFGMTDCITFAPKVEDHEIRDFYAACDAFVFPNDQQTWGLVVLEAMACGCPVLVSTGAGVHEVLEDGLTASLFPPKNPVVLAEKIQQLVADHGFRNRIAQNGMRVARERYTWGCFSEEVETICQRALKDNVVSSLAKRDTSSSLAGVG